MSRTVKLVLLSMVVALILASMSLLGDRGARRVRRMEAEIRAREAQNLALAEENRSLKQEIHALQTDPRAVERAAREELGLIKPGEVVFSF